jgi:hypothetical protein
LSSRASSRRRRQADRAGQVKRRSGGVEASRHAVAVRPSALRRTRPAELALRFVFGAGISLVAGLVGIRFGPRAGGLFLAFPAILPATLTMVEKHEGEGAADADAQGGILGGVGLVAFALVVALTVRVLGAPLALTAALGAWVLVAAGLYLALRQLWTDAWG